MRSTNKHIQVNQKNVVKCKQPSNFIKCRENVFPSFSSCGNLFIGIVLVYVSLSGGSVEDFFVNSYGQNIDLTWGFMEIFLWIDLKILENSVLIYWFKNDILFFWS